MTYMSVFEILYSSKIYATLLLFRMFLFIKLVENISMLLNDKKEHFIMFVTQIGVF
jgi:hypothetical protein